MKTTRLILIIGGFLSATATITPGVEITLKPVSASGVHTINGNEIILYGPGQRVTLEVGTDHWGPSPLKTYQVQIDCTSYSTGKSGVLGPVVQPCPTANSAGNAFCQNTFGDVGLGASRCVDLDLGSGVALQCEPGWLNRSRTDWVFFGHDVAVASVDLSDCNTRMGAALNPDSPVIYTGIEKYCGTILLQIPSDAAGEFTINFKPGGGITFLADENNNEIGPLVLLPATIIIAPPPAYGACCDHTRRGGECTDNVAESICLATGEQMEFFPDQTCAATESAGLCEEQAGACCVERICTDNVAKSACASETWLMGVPCDDPEIAELCAEQPVSPIPVISEWGLMILALLLLVGGKVYFGQRTFAD